MVNNNWGVFLVGGYYIGLLAINYIVKPEGDLERAFDLALLN